MRKKLLTILTVIILLFCATFLVACKKEVVEQKNDLIVDACYQNYRGLLEVTFKNPEVITKSIEYKINDGEWTSGVHEYKPNTYILVNDEVFTNLVNTTITIDFRKCYNEDNKNIYEPSPGLQNKIKYFVKPCLSYNQLHDAIAFEPYAENLFQDYTGGYDVLDESKKNYLKYPYYEENTLIEYRFYKYAIMLKNNKLLVKQIDIKEIGGQTHFSFTNVPLNLFKIAPSEITEYDVYTRMDYYKTYTWYDVTPEGLDIELFTIYTNVQNDTERQQFAFFLMLNETSEHTASIYNNFSEYVIIVDNKE